MKNLIKKNKFLVVALCTLVLATLLSWCVASGFGSTKIQRFTAAGENGGTMSYVTFIPKNATIHIQKMAPGPPDAIAAATPAILPVPIVAASAVQRLWN